jgi:hypothetical protein
MSIEMNSDAIRLPSVIVPVLSSLADQRGGLSGDRRLIDDGDAFDDVSVAGSDLVSCDDATVADFQLSRLNGFDRLIKFASVRYDSLQNVDHRPPQRVSRDSAAGLVKSGAALMAAVGCQGPPQPPHTPLHITSVQLRS